MLKFYRPHGEQMLLATAYLRTRGASADDVITTLRNYPAATSEQGEILNNARRQLRVPTTPGQHWLDDLIKQLYRSLADEAQGRGESDLIDQIVRVLQLPYGRNILTGERLRMLRQALLLPSEQAGLVQRLRQKEMSCSNCGLALHNEESVTVVQEGGGVQSIVCHRCHPPHSVPCASCAETASLSTKAMNAMSRMQCPTCQEAKTPKKAPASPADEVITEAPAERVNWSSLRNRVAPTPRALAVPTAWVTNDTVTITGGGGQQ